MYLLMSGEQVTGEPVKEGKEKSFQNLTPWEAGQSGNPSGLVHGNKLIQALRGYTSDTDDIIRVVIGIVKGDVPAPPAVRWDAVKWTLERIYGKVPTVELQSHIGLEITIKTIDSSQTTILAASAIMPIEEEAPEQS